METPTVGITMLKKLLFAALLCVALPSYAQLDGVIYRTTQKPLVNGQSDKMRADVNGNIMVNCATGCSGGGGGSNPAAGQTGATIPAYADYMGFLLGGNLVGVSSSNPLPVAVQGSVAVTGTFYQATQPISATSLPLPTGAATAANQTTGNTSLATLATNLPAQGQALMAASTPVVIASNQSAIPISASSLPLPTGAATAANQTTANTSLATIATNIPAQGQAAMAASTPVVIASNQSSVPVSVNTDSYAITQTSVAITATSGQLIAANSTRKYLSFMVVGTQSVTCVPGSSAAVVGAGFVYGGGGANLQGASQEFPHGAPTSAFQCIAPATGSTIYVWEGN